MADRVFNRDTLLDITVNLIPMGIVLFFIVLFLLYDPFGYDPVGSIISIALLVIPFVVLAAFTYITGRIIAEAEHTGSSGTAEAITKFTAGKAWTGDEDDTE